MKTQDYLKKKNY